MPEVTVLDRVESSDGTPIAVWRSGSGPALVLVHGTTADHTRWAQVSPRFALQFTVYAMDRRGRGESGDADSCSIEQEGEDIVAVAEWVDGPVSLLGHSYGAICCIEAALRLPGLHRLVLYEPPLVIGPEIVPAALRAELERLVAQNEREAALLTFFREVVRVPEPQLELMKTHPAWPGRVASAHTVARELRLQDEYRLDLERVRAIDTPTLLLLGGDSPAFFQDATRHLHEAIPNSRIHYLRGQQHLAMDIIPDDFVQIVASFVLS